MKEILCISGLVLGLMLLAESANADSKPVLKKNINKCSISLKVKSNSKNNLKDIKVEVSDEN